MREGFYRIEFYKMDGTADADGAKRVFDYCAENENYSGWFIDDFINPMDDDSETDTMFTLDGNRWVLNLNAETEDTALGGTPLNLDDWLLPACREAKAERVIASAMISHATFSWDDCKYEEVLYENGAKVRYNDLPYFNLSWAPSRFLFKKLWGGVRVHVKAVEETENSFRPLRGVFKKKTGEKVLGGYVVHYKDDGDDIDKCPLTFEIGRVKAALSDDDDGLADEDEGAEAVREFVRLYNYDNDADEDAADWTFEGFDCEKDFFALYGAQGEENYECVFGDEEDYCDYATDLEEYNPLEDDE